MHTYIYIYQNLRATGPTGLFGFSRFLAPAKAARTCLRGICALAMVARTCLPSLCALAIALRALCAGKAKRDKKRKGKGLEED